MSATPNAAKLPDALRGVSTLFKTITYILFYALLHFHSLLFKLPKCSMHPFLTSETLDLITSYHELNSGSVDELREEPSPLEFMRYVARNLPFVVRKGASNWAATKEWNAKYLVDVMGERLVNVAITPHG